MISILLNIGKKNFLRRTRVRFDFVDRTDEAVGPCFVVFGE
jgi:hypothetical protein